VADTVEALVRLRACDAARGEVVNVGHDEPVSIRELATRVIQTLGTGSVVEFVSYEQAYAAGFEDMRNRRPALEKLARLTGFRPERSLQQIIQEVAATPMA
jgi:UDP-glucose 4-epimerase